MTFFRLFMAACGLASFGAWAACTKPFPNPIPAGTNITECVEAASNGDVLILAPGDYTAANTILFPFTGSFGIARGVTIRGGGTDPSQVRLHGGAAAQFAVLFLRYPLAAGVYGDPSGARLENLTIDTAQGGAQVYDFVYDQSSPPTPTIRFTDITLKDVVINTPNAGNGFGVLVKKSDRIVMDNVTVTAYNTPFNLVDVSGSLLMSSNAVSSVAANAPALAVQGGSGNVIVGNTFGQPKAVPTFDGNYSFTAGGIVFQNTRGNRFENNTVQGFRQDGLDFTATDLTAVLPTQGTQNSTDNYAAKNRVISTGFAANLAGGSGIWANCGSHNTWLYANDSQGSRECGICVFTSNSNMLLGNTVHNHGIDGVFVSGDANDTSPFCAGGVAGYEQRPVNTFIRNNFVYFNKEDQVLVRTADNTDVSFNTMAPNDGRTGPAQPPLNPSTGQSALFLQTPNGAAVSNGFHVMKNTSLGNMRGLWDDDGVNDPGLEFFLNRIIGSAFSRFMALPTLNIDAGPTIGGNFWANLASATANPSPSSPYSGVYTNLANATGAIVDRYPFRTEDLGRGYSVTVAEPLSGTIVGQGTLRTVRWTAPGCSWVDMSLDNTTPLATDLANTGYAVVTIPANAAVGAHSIAVACKDSLGNLKGSGNSPSFTVRDGSLQLMSPGRDDVFNGGASVIVGWKKTSAVATVDIQVSTDGGTTWTNPTLTVGGTAATGLANTAARINLPATTTSKAMLRVVSGTTYGDTTDGVFAIRGTAAFTNVPTGRKFSMGGIERLEWTSPLNSRVVNLTANGTPIATGLPDRGYFDWIPKDLGAVTVTLNATFFDSNAVNLGSTSTGAGSTLYTTTITIAPLGSIAPGTSQTVSATTNSGAAVTLSSLTTSVCTVSGATVSAIANGTCTLQGTAPATGNYAAPLPATSSFVVGAVSTRVTGISTRMQVLTGNNVLIGGFIISGTTPKTVVINARGPSLVNQGVAGAMQNPFLQVVSGSTIIAQNDDWGAAPYASQLSSLGLAPPNPLESSVLTTLAPGAYTAIVSGVGGGTGVGIVEVFEVDHPDVPLTGISTRGEVLTNNDVMIGGFIIQGTTPLKVVVRARGPSLASQGVTGALQDPVLLLVPGDGSPTITNDNWQSDPNSSQLSAIGYAPTDPRESALLVTLNPGAYTAIVSGANGTTGIGIVEVYVP